MDKNFEPFRWLVLKVFLDLYNGIYEGAASRPSPQCTCNVYIGTHLSVFTQKVQSIDNPVHDIVNIIAGG